MDVLQRYFDEDPNWTFATKMKIAVEIKSTPGVVSKWNWDQRKKLGMPTERKGRRGTI